MYVQVCNCSKILTSNNEVWYFVLLLACQSLLKNKKIKVTKYIQLNVDAEVVVMTKPCDFHLQAFWKVKFSAFLGFLKLNV